MLKRRAILLSSIALVSVLLIASVGIAWWYVFHTAAGMNFVIQKINHLQQPRIVLSGVTGNLGEPISIQHFELDEDHVHVVADDIKLQLTPLALLAFTVRAANFSASQVVVTLKQAPDTPVTKPLRFLPSYLSISVGQATIAKPQLITAGNTLIEGKLAQASFSMNSQRIRIGEALVETAQYSATGKVAITANRPLNLEINGTIHVPASRGVTIAAEANLVGTADKLHVTGKLLSPALAAIDGDLFRGATQWQIAGNLTSDRIGLEPWLERPPFSLQSIALQLSGEPTNLKLKGVLTAPEIDRQPLNVAAQVTYAARVLSIVNAVIEPTDTDMTTITTARITFGDAKPRVNIASRWKNLRWPIREPFMQSAAGEGTFEGSLPYAVTLKAEIAIPAATSGTIEARGSILETAIAVDSYKLSTLEGEAQGKGRWNFSAQPTWALQATASNLNPQAVHHEWFDEFPGRLNFVADGSGTGFGKQAAFDLHVASLSGTLRGEKISGKGAIALNAKSWSAKDLSLSLGANRLALNGSLSDHSDLTWSIDVPAIERFITNAAGELHTHGALHGARAAPQGSVIAVGKQLRYGDWRATTLNIDTNIDLAEGHASKLNLSGTDVGWRDFALDELRINSSGSAAMHTVELQGTLTPREITTFKPKTTAKPMSQHLSMTATGQYQRDGWRGTLSALQLNDQDDNPPTAIAPAAAASATKDEAQLGRWCALWQDRKLCASGSWLRHGDWQAAVDSDELTLGVFDGTFPSSAHYQGRWKIHGQMAGHQSGVWTGDANVQVSDATLTYQPIEGAEETVQLGSGRLEFNAAADLFTASGSITTPGTTTIEAAARIVRSSQIPFSHSPLTGTLAARTQDANLLPLFFADLDRSAGDLHANLKVNGSLAVPQLQGDIQLEHGELDLYRYNLRLREIGAQARIADNRIDFNAGAHAGDGKFDINGQLAWTNSRPLGRLRLQGENLLVADLLDYRVIASPDVMFAIDGKRIDMSGEVVIPSAHIQPTDVRGAVQRSPDAQLTAEKLEDQRGFQIYSDVRITLGDDVRLDTYGLQGQLRGAVNTSTRPNEVARGRGELNVSDGRYEAYGQKLAIERGRLLFDASPLDDPGLDILADRDIESQKVGVNVRGTLRAPRMTLYADPSLAQGQIVSYLFTGKPLDDLRTRDTAAIGNASNELALQGGGLLASQIGRRVGLEAVSVESNGLNDTSLVLGKFLSPRLFVSYGISLTESINTLKLRYTISDRWLFKTEAGQYQSGDLEFRIEH